MTLALISGFVAHFPGGYMVAMLGSLFVLATAGVFVVEGGIALLAMTLGFAVGALLASLAPLVLDFLEGSSVVSSGRVMERGPVNTSGGATRALSE